MAFQRVIAARLDFYNADGSLAVSVQGKDVKRIQIREEANDAADQASISLHNYQGALSNRVDVDQEIRVFLQLQGDAALTHVWTGIVDETEPTREDTTKAGIDLVAFDYVFRILQDRDVSYAFNATDGGAAIRSLLRDYAPEIPTSGVKNLGVNVTMAATGQRLYEAVKEIARRCDATVSSNPAKQLIVHSRASVESFAKATYANVAPRSLRVRKVRPEANVVRVWGGDAKVTGEAYDPATKSWQTVTDTARVQVKVNIPKQEVTSVEIWTDPAQTNADVDLRVRIQADENGAPRDPANYDMDLASKIVSPEHLTAGGYTTFNMPSHTLGAGNAYWLILEATGPGGQAVGVDGSGKPAFKLFHPAPIIVERSDFDSIAKHRRIIKTIRRRSIADAAEATQIADTELARMAAARWEVAYHDVETESWDTADKLLAYYRMDERAGSVTKDGAGLQGDATLYDGATWTDGKHGAGIEFDGVKGYLGVPSAGLPLRGSWSFEIWIKLTSDPNVSTDNNWRRFLTRELSSAPFYMFLEQNRTVNLSVVKGGKAFRYFGGAFSSETLTVGELTHLVYQYDATTGKGYAYKNGVLSRSGVFNDNMGVNVTPGDLDAGSGEWRISWPSGTATPNGSGALPAVVDGAGFRSRLLTAEEVAWRYQAGQQLRTPRFATLGETVELSFPDEGATGAFVLQSQTHVYDAQKAAYTLAQTLTQREGSPDFIKRLGEMESRLGRVEDSIIGKNNAFLTDLFRAMREPMKIADAITTTTTTSGTFTVDSAKVGLSDIR